MPVNPKTVVNNIKASVDFFQSGLPVIEKKALDSIQILLKELKINTSENIKMSVENLRLIAKIKNKLSAVILDKKYLNKVYNLQSAFDDVTKLQTDYFGRTFEHYSKPAIVEELKKISVTSTIESLNASSINSKIITKASDIVFENIKAGKSFAKMNDELKEFIIGSDKIDSKLASYSKQILTDSISQYSANYNKIATDDLGLEWYGYVGTLVAASRPICDTLVAKEWIHISELSSIAHGTVDGESIDTTGMIPGTNAGNFQINRGGFNCAHQLMPVPEEAVPKSIRIAMYNR